MRGLAAGRIRIGDVRCGFAAVGERWGFVDRVVDWHVVYLVTAGAIDLRLPGGRHRLVAGTLLWMPPGVRHHLRPAPPPTLYYLSFRSPLGGSPCRPRRDAIILPQAVGLKPSFEQLFIESDSRRAYRDERLHAQLILLCSAILRGAERAEGGAQLSEGQRGRLLQVVRVRGAARTTPSALASVLGVSPARFARIFKSTYGVTARSWLADKRIEAAAHRLLEDDARIGEVADELGYADIFAFSHQFRAVMGCSPRTFRERHSAT
jgi:AraC-like DNA-binding protein